MNRFATRAKQVKNKPVVNKVISESVALKRMTNRISVLEEQLSEKEKTLKVLKGGLLNYQRAESFPLLKNRRHTWAFPLKPFEDVTTTQSPQREHINNFGTPTPKSIFGQVVEYTDEEFEQFVNSSLLSDNNRSDIQLCSTSPSSHLARPQIMTTPSLLKMPKPVRRLLTDAQPAVSQELVAQMEQMARQNKTLMDRVKTF